MTRWALLLLAAYVALGLSSIETRRAVRYAVATTAVVIVAVALRYGAIA